MSDPYHQDCDSRIRDGADKPVVSYTVFPAGTGYPHPAVGPGHPGRGPHEPGSIARRETAGQAARGGRDQEFPDRRCPAVPVSRGPRAYPFSPVRATLSMMRRRRMRKMTSMGTTLITDPAISFP